MSASTPSKSILRIDDDLIAQGCDVNAAIDSATGYDIVPICYRTPELAKSAAGGKIAALLAQKQPIPFLSQFLV